MSAPFIGSRISLISKSDVRYEGILCGIDTSESKVYLQHGKLLTEFQTFNINNDHF